MGELGRSFNDLLSNLIAQLFNNLQDDDRGFCIELTQQLGMSRNTLYRKLKRHRIAVGPARRDQA